MKVYILEYPDGKAHSAWTTLDALLNAFDIFANHRREDGDEIDETTWHIVKAHTDEWDMPRRDSVAYIRDLRSSGWPGME